MESAYSPAKESYRNSGVILSEDNFYQSHEKQQTKKNLNNPTVTILTSRYSKRNSLGPESPLSGFGGIEEEGSTTVKRQKVNEDHPETKIDENSSEIGDGICNTSNVSQSQDDSSIIEDGVQTTDSQEQNQQAFIDTQ